MTIAHLTARGQAQTCFCNVAANVLHCDVMLRVFYSWFVIHGIWDHEFLSCHHFLTCRHPATKTQLDYLSYFQEFPWFEHVRLNQVLWRKRKRESWWYFASRASLSVHRWFLLQAPAMRVCERGSYHSFDERSLAPGHGWCISGLPSLGCATGICFPFIRFFPHIPDKKTCSIASDSERYRGKMKDC